MGFTAGDYRTTIEVLREHSCSDLAEGFLEFEARANKREHYAAELGLLSNDWRGQSGLSVGLRVLDFLLKGGWTPPKGLL
jgi:hypothetical protein